MATFYRDHSSKTYILARTKRRAVAFAKKKGLTNYVAITRVEDLPRQNHLTVITVGTDYHEMEDAECLFGVGGLFYDFKADIYRDYEIPACH